MKNKKENEEIEVLDFDVQSDKEEKSKKEKKEKLENDEEREERENIFKRLFNNIKDKWDNLTHKQRIIIIVSTVIVLIILLTTLLYIALTNDKDNDKKEVIVAKDNYRYEDGILYFVVNHKDIGSYKCKNKDEDLCYVAYEDNDDNFDETQTIKKGSKKIRSKIMNKKYVFVFDNKKESDDNIILYDIKNQKDLDIYKSIKTYNTFDNAVFVKNQDDKYGVMDFSGSKRKAIIDFDYDYLGIVTENKAANDEKIVAREQDGYYLIDYDGKKLTNALSGQIKNYNDQYVKTVDATNKYTLYDYQGAKKAEGANYIDLLDNEYLIVDNENKLKVMGYDDTKYLEEGIPLYNTDYVPVVHKDKNNKETKKDYAYTYTLDGNNLTLNVNKDGEDEESKINLLDGIVSKKYKFISYYNGALYFYSDEAKNTLINSYICNNKNELAKEDDTFQTCMLAGDTNEDDNETNQKVNPASITPIYNNRYVFIKDGNMINLVDLTDEKVMGTYNSINTYSDANVVDPSIVNTESTFVIAKNKSNKYGMLKISSNSVSSVYNFDYQKLEKLNQNILAKKDNKTFLLDYNGNKITFDFPGQIRNYNKERIKVLSNSKYYIYDFGGNLLFEDGYKYVELYDDFVGLVDDANHLSVTDYDGNLIIKEILKLSSTTYYNAKDGYVPAFSMRKENNKLIITAATSQNTKKESAKDFIYDLTTKKRIN